ncbi:hypothetical protein GYMLUDRAFT_68120 [Collybiopsis luxurians FD-317 M1]|nr:hypothetical protein GYMLUDRAFT_68120 [Collybiopsis luxurians FD-317 M1]
MIEIPSVLFDSFNALHSSLADTIRTARPMPKQNAKATMSDIEMRLRHLLDSNDPPLPLDIPVINESIDFLDSYLLKLQTMVGKVKKQRRRCIALLSGIRMLPPEILSEIFVYAASENLPTIDSRHYAFLYPNFHDLPFVFSKVCRRWREVAISTPALWSCITLIHRTPATQTKHSALVDHCLGRSRLSPMYITLRVQRSFGPDEQLEESDKRKVIEGALGTLGELVKQIDCWKFFDFYTGSFHSITSVPSFPDIPSTGAPNLSTLCYSGFDGESDIESEAALWIYKLLGVSPNLLHLNLHTDHLPSLKGISWKRLETFEASPLELKDLFNVLMNCPALESCDVTLHDSEDPFIPAFDIGEITLRRLHSFRLTAVQEEDVASVFRWLNLPALKTLTLEGADNLDPFQSWVPLPIADFLSRSKCCLESLALVDLPFEEEWLISNICHPSIHDTLESLRIERWKVTVSDRFLQLLTFTFSSNSLNPLPSPFFPKLSDISISINGISQSAFLKRLVASRWFDSAANDVPLPVACLTRIQICFVVPRIPNGKVSVANSMEWRFERISKTTELEFWDAVMDSYEEEEAFPGIEDVFWGSEDLNKLPWPQDRL